VEDIYFLIGLSRLGSPISLSSSRRGGELVKDYISAHYRSRLQPTKDGKIEIKYVVHLALKTILFILSRFANSDTLHLANRSHTQYAPKCMELIIFNLSERVLANMKEQLTKAKYAWLKNFGYGLILISFTLE